MANFLLITKNFFKISFLYFFRIYFMTCNTLFFILLRKTSKLPRAGSLNTELKKVIEEVKATTSKRKTFKLDPFFPRTSGLAQV